MNDETVKAIKYNLIFVENLIKYAFRKVHLPFFEVWVGQKCNLKCANCCHLIPYTNPKLYDINKIISDCKVILSICNIDYFSILGGEPFLNKNISELINFVADCDSIRDGKIVTNGTVLPDKRTLYALIHLNGKLEVRIDEYPGTEKKVEAFYNLMTQNNIRCHITRFKPKKESSWKMLSSPLQDKQAIIMTDILFRSCQVRHCYTLANGEFTSCPRGITTESVCHIPKNKYENVNIRNIRNKLICKAYIATAITERLYKDYFRYCLSLSNLNPYSIIPGEQLTQEFLDKIGVILK